MSGADRSDGDGSDGGEDVARTVWEGKWLRMRQQGRWEYVERTNDRGMAVIILAVTPAGDLEVLPQRHGTNGAYAARLVRARGN